MSFAGVRILSRIVLVGAVFAAEPEVAFAQSCNGGSANPGDVLPVTLSLDNSQLAQYTLDSAATDISMLIVDDQSNVACDTSMVSANHLSCNWMPVPGATYTVQVMRPAQDPSAANASQTSGSEAYNLCSMGAS